jgi:vacuolar-type H+-ATPase subunit E/Vma4
MSASSQNSPDVLCREILADAGRECEDILRRANAEAEAMLAAAAIEAEEIRRKRREQTRAEAVRRKELTLASVAVETRRIRGARIETLVESVRENIRQRLLARDMDAREIVVALASGAIRRMAGNGFVLKISGANHAAFGDGLAGQIARQVGLSTLNLKIAADAAATDGGVIVESADGFQIWDNRLLSRLERFWPELRREIAIRTSLAGENNSKGSGT